MAFEVKDLAARKQRLLTQSERLRGALGEEFQQVKTTTAWMPRTVRVVRASYPVLLLGAPLLGYLLTRKKRHKPIPQKASRRNGVVASAFAGYKLFRQMKPVWEGLRSWRSH
jgi:hypothetical protein